MNINTKRKVKKYGIIATCMTMIAVLAFATNKTVHNQVNATEEIEQYAQPKQYVSFEDLTYTIQLNVDELQHCTFPNMYNSLDNNVSYNGIKIYYQDDAYTYNSELSTDGALVYEHSEDNTINFINNNVEFNLVNDTHYNNYQFTLNGGDNNFTEFINIELTDEDAFYTEFKNAITLDIANYDYTHLPYAVKLQAQQLNNDKFTYLAEQVNDNELTTLDMGSIIYNNNIYYCDDVATQDSISYKYNLNENEFYRVGFVLDNASDYAQFYLQSFLNNEYNDLSLTSFIIIYDSQFIYENIYAPLNTADIPDAITSGLGIIGDLASEFLNGFTTLFWDSDNARLTYFAIFSLCFLGVAISIAVVKLASRMIRNNTGV